MGTPRKRAGEGASRPAGSIRAAPEAADGNRPPGREYGPPVWPAVNGGRKRVTEHKALKTNLGGTARINLVP